MDAREYFKRFSRVLAGLLLVASGVAVGQESQPAPVETPGAELPVNYYHVPGTLTFEIGAIANELDFSDSGVDLGIAYQVSPHWSLEARLGIPGAEYYSLPPYSRDQVADVTFVGEPQTLAVGFNLLYGFRTECCFSPHVGFGFSSVELYDYEGVEGSSDSSSSSYQAISSGVFDSQLRFVLGFRYWFKPNFFVRIDLNGHRSLDHSTFHSSALASLGFTLGALKVPGVTQPVPVSTAVRKCPDPGPGIPVDENGCPLDEDGDGVANHLDECPGTPSGPEVDSRGCLPDSDADGVADYRDQCPDTIAGMNVDRDGCRALPDGLLAFEILFDADWAVVDEAEVDAQQVADFVQMLAEYDYPPIVLEGHADSSPAPRGYNQELARLRAQRVKEYLEDVHGLTPDRIQIDVVGYGTSRPRASNATERGRQLNRRVQARAKRSRTSG